MAKKTLKELLDERALKAEAADTASKVGDAESRNLTPEEFKTFNDLLGEVRALDEQIVQARAIEAFQAGRAQGFPGGGESGNRDTSPGDQRDMAGYNLNKALLAKVDGRALDGVEAEVQQVAEARAKEDGIKLNGNGVVVLDEVLQKRGQTVTLQTANPGDQGGLLVQKQMQGVLGIMQANTFLDKVGARFMTGLSDDLVFPVQETTPTIQELTEIEEGGDTEVLFSSFEMKPQRRFTNVPISRQLLIQSSIDMQNFVITVIGIALSQKMNAEAVAHLLTIINAVNGNLISLGTNGDTIDYNDVVALEALIEGFDHLRGEGKYLTNSKVKAKLKTTQVFTGTNGVPVWSGDDVLNGYRAISSNIVPSNITKGTGTNLSAMFFGIWSDFMVGLWGGTEYIIDHITLKKKAQLEITANAFWNMKAARAKSFAGIKDIVTTL